MRPSRGLAGRGAGVALAIALTTAPLAGQEGSIDGAWLAEDYTLASGAVHEVRGQIHFDDGRWVVLFFVMDGDVAARGSAEGGRYTLRGDTLTFEHLHHLSVGEAVTGLPASPLRLETRSEGAREPTGIRLSGNELTLLFPSGNRMRFRRATGR